ncbi:hypothetical protein QN393_25985, partial [Pseudomonas sp. AB12(2023)]|nr:hypothetical protein [Pseudomonas sp. AB12(2023)]
SWRSWFEGLEGSTEGASWQQANWPLSSTDDLTSALDPTQMEPAPKPARGGAKPAPAAAAAPAPSQDAILRAASDSIRAMMLIRT